MKLLFFNTFLLLSLIGINTVNGQDVKEDFKKINDAYKYPNLSMKVVYKAYLNDAKEPAEKKEGVVRKSYNKTYHKLGNIEVVNTKDNSLTIDHDEKFITLLKKYSDPGNQEVLNIDPLKLLDVCDQVEYSENKNGEGKYLLVCQYSSYESIEVLFDRKTFFITKLILVQPAEESQKVKLEIIYSDIDKTENISADIFSLSRYLNKQGDTYSPVAQLKDYEFIKR